MNRPKNQKHLLFFLLLTTCLSFLLYLHNQRSKNLGHDAFALKNEASVNKILLYNHNLPIGGFTQEDGYWKLNDSINVDEELANMLLKALSTLSLKGKVAESKRKKVKEHLKEDGFVVEYYHKNSLTKAFFIGSIKDNASYTYAMLEGDDVPYIIYIPRVKQNLTNILSLPPIKWTDRALFQSHAKELTNIKVKYTSSLRDSFQIRQDKKGIYSVDGYKIKNSFISQYLKNFENIKADAYVTSNKILIDSIKLSRPFCHLLIEGGEGDGERSISFYTSPDSTIMYAQAENKEILYVFNLESIKSLFIKKKELLQTVKV